MNKFRNFVIENKGVIYTILFTILAILLVTLLVIMTFSKEGNSTQGTSSSVMPSNSKNNSTTQDDTTTESISDETTDETTESTEETTTENITEETTTKVPVAIDYPYIIKVNRAANCTTVYGKDENGNYTVPVKAITVSCGKVINDTPLGDYNTIISYDWRLLFGNVYGQYSYRIIGSTLFHSVPYYTKAKNDLEWEEYNKLGTSASAGCVRMTVADAKWLIDNCPIGTRVIIYDDPTNPGPLGKPDTIKIPADSPHKGWDPTDPDANNPWHKFKATITYPSTKTITLDEGTVYEKLLSNFSAKDTCGNDITNKIKIDGNYDLNVAGSYNIKVHVTDAIGKYAEVDITLNVAEKETPSTTPEEIITSSSTTSSSEETTTTVQESTSDNVTTETPVTDVESTNSETGLIDNNDINGEETTSPMP